MEMKMLFLVWWYVMGCYCAGTSVGRSVVGSIFIDTNVWIGKATMYAENKTLEFKPRYEHPTEHLASFRTPCPHRTPSELIVTYHLKAEP